MTIMYINTGSGPNSGNGDSLRVAFTKINQNFSEVIQNISEIVPTDQSLNTTDSVRFANSTITNTLTIGPASGSVIDFNPVRVNGDSSAYLATVIGQNANSGTNASTDFVLMNNLGDENNHYIDLGINSSNYSAAMYGVNGTNDGYLYVSGGNLSVGTQTPGTRLVFHAGGTTELDAGGHLDTEWHFNRPVIVQLDQPGSAEFLVWNTSNHPDASSFYEARNGNGGYVRLGVNSHFATYNPDEVYLYPQGPGEAFHIGNTTDIKFYANTSTGNTGTATLKLDKDLQSAIFDGHVLPTTDLAYDLGSTSSQWRSLYVGTSTVYFGGIPLSVTSEGGITVNDVPVVGSPNPVQSYLQLTNEPLIIQPVVLGTPVTVTVPLAGIDSLFQVDILEGPVLGGITVTQPGTGYVVGQNYIIYYYQLGGITDAGSLTFTIDTVDQNGGILTITNVQFVGVPDNAPGSYGSVGVTYRPQLVIDQIDTGLTLKRDANQGIYNSALELEYDNITYLSPLGTEWNSEGWGNLAGLGTRSYTTWRAALNNAVGNNIVASELVMHDIANDKYYKFDFTNWGGSNGSYSYTRTEVTDPNYFRKPHNAEAADVVVADTPPGTGIGLVRTTGDGLWNLYQEEGYNSSTSPLGTTWNADGWTNLTDLATRTYTNFTLATNYYDVLGKQFVMYVASIGKYYAIQFYEWATNGNNNFAYARYEIDQTKLNEGIKFSDGTVLKSAAGVGRVKSTAPGNRRIEEVTGYNQVAVTGRTTSADIPATVYGTAAQNLNWYVDIVWDTSLNAYAQGTTPYSLTVSTDGGNTWYPAYLGGYNTDISQQIVVTGGASVLQAAADSVIAYRVITGADPVVWWDKADLPGGGADFRGAVIDYHAWTGESTIIGTIHIVDDAGENHISHQEVQSGSTDGENDDLWLVTTEGQIQYRRIDGESKTLKIHWTAKVFYGSEFWD